MEIDIIYEEIDSPHGFKEWIPVSRIQFFQGERFDMEDFNDALHDGPREAKRTLQLKDPKKIGEITVSGVIDEDFVRKKIRDHRTETQRQAIVDGGEVVVNKKYL